ncbi:MAG: hypothetical protein Kow0059_08350 [Candidatus Sumerlaeia bacterium]
MPAIAALWVWFAPAVVVGAGAPEQVRLAALEWAVCREPGIESRLSASVPPESPAPDGMAIYPDKDAPDDDVEHGAVWLRARIQPPRAGVPIFFRVYDVDDPADEPEIDPNGDWGGDNDLATTMGSPGLFRPTTGVVLLPGTADDAQGCFTAVARVPTDENGEALVLFECTRQPGDNFRAAACLASSDADALRLLDAVSTRGLALAPPPGAPKQGFALSQLLTVHRRLWIQIDKLAPTPQYEPHTGRLVFGPETGIVGAIARSADYPHIYYIFDDTKAERWSLNPTLYQDSTDLPQERSCYFQPNPARNEYFNIIGIEQRDGRPLLAVRTDARFIRTSQGWYLQPQPAPIALNDRATTGAPYAIETEDSPANAESPTIEHSTRVFARCYITAERDPHLGGRVLPWVRNLSNEDLIAFGRASRRADPLYWQCYLLGAYEYTVAEDGDPDWHAMAWYTPVTEGVTVREMPFGDYRYTAIFYETAMENWAGSADVRKFLDVRIIAHELVHQFDVLHGHGLMEDDPDVRELWLRPRDVARVRAVRAP